MSDKDLKTTLKAGTGYDDPWVTVDANEPTEMLTKLQGLVAAGVLQAVVDTANHFKALNNAAPLAQQQAFPQQQAQQQAQPVQHSPWGASPQGQPQQQQPQQQRAQLHPEGKACHCGNALERKTTQNGKAKWQCPDWRWNNGNPNGHAMEWAN